MDIKKLKKKWDSVDTSNIMKNKMENVRQSQQRQQREKVNNAKIELSDKQNLPSKFVGNNQPNQYSFANRVMQRQQEILQQTRPLINKGDNPYNITIPEHHKFNEVVEAEKKQKRNETMLSKGGTLQNQEEIDKASKLTNQQRLDIAKYRDEETHTKARLKEFDTKNAELEQKVNEAKGLEKIGNTALYLGNEFFQNAVASTNEIGASMRHLAGADENRKNMEFAQAYSQATGNIGSRVQDKFIQALGMGLGGMGQQAPQYLFSAGGMLPTGGLVGGVSEFANTYNEMTLENPANRNKTIATALLKGTVAGALEEALGFFGKGSLDKMAVSSIAKVQGKNALTTWLKRKALSMGYNVGSEGLEENLENFAGYAIDRVINKKDITMQQMLEEFKETTKQTGATTILMSLFGLDGTMGEAQNLSNQYDYINSTKLSTKEKNNLKDWVTNENVSNDKLITQIGKMTQENTLANKMIEANIKDNQKQASTMQNEAVLESNKQTTLEQGKLPQKQSSKQIDEVVKNGEYNREESVKRAFESAKKYNKDITSETFREIVRKADERGASVYYDDVVFGNNTKRQAVWKIQKDKKGNVISREIILNPNAEGKMTLEQIFTHELSHDMEGNKIYQGIRSELLEFLQKKPEYPEAYNELKQIYSQVYAKDNLTEKEFISLIEDEVVADMLGTKLGSTDFLKSLTIEKRSIAKIIYDWVVDRLNRLNKKVGYVSEKLFWEDIKNKFENAFKEGYVNTDSKVETKSLTNKEIKYTTYNLENSTYLDYNNKRQLIPDKLIPYISVEEEKAKYLKYSQNEAFYELDVEEMDNAISIGSEYVLKSFKEGLTEGEFKTDKYIYEYDILGNDGDFGIKNIEKIKEISEEAYVEGENERNSEISTQQYGLQQGRNNNDNKSLGNTESSRNVARLDKTTRTDELFNNEKKSKRNSRKELDNSSFFNGKFSIDTNSNGTLLALHNLTVEKLRGILELGGFPVPSIAITNPKNFDHSNYGEISVIFNKNTVNPVDSRNEVYSRDGYTPRFPKIGYKINNKIRQSLKDSLRQYVTGSMYDNSYLSNVSSLLDEVNLSEKLNSNNGLDGTIENLSKNESIKYWYLKEKNIPFEEQYREQNYSSVVKNDMLQKFLDNYKGDKNTLNELNFEQIQELKTELEQLWIEENFDTEQMKKWLSEHPNYSPDLDYSKLSNIVMGAYKLNKYGSKKTLDTAKTNEVINSIAKEEDVKSWLKNKFDGIVEKKGIKNSKGFYTNTGTPRSFDQLYDDYTLDNVVKIMTALDTTGTESFFGVGTNEILGTSAKKFDSIEQIKEYENKLLKNLTPEQYAEYLEPINQKLKDIETSILEINPTHSNSFMAIDNLGVAIQEVARKLNGKTKLTTSRVISIMNKQGYEVTSEQAQELLNFFEEARKLPTQYFEAKPQRAVGFEEIASMVIPNNLDAELKQQLQDRGINLIEYDPNVEGDRNKKMLSEEMSQYKFSLSTETKANIEAKIDRYSRIVEEMQQEGRDSDDWAPYANEILRLQDQIDGNKYSRETSGAWQAFKDKYAKNTGKGKTNQEITLPQSNVLKDNVSNSKNISNSEVDKEIAKVLNTPVVRQKPKDRKWAILKANLIDKGIVFEELSKKANNRELEAKWDYSLTSGARAQNAIGNPRYEFINGERIKVAKGLTEIIDEVGDKVDDFQNYMYHLLNIDRMSLKERFGIDNKPVFGANIGKDFSERKVAEFEKANPKFKEWAQDVYNYANADKMELVKNGVISQELSDKFEEMYPHYIPIQRADKLGNAVNLPLDTRKMKIGTPIKQAKGGSSDLNPLFETLAGRTMQTYRASARNSLGVELKNTLQTLNSLNSETNNADLDSIIETMSNENSSEELLKASKNGKLPTFTVFERGNKVTYEINEDIFDALKPLDNSSILNKKSKILNTVGNLRRAVLTEYNPMFFFTNPIKDIQDAMVNSQHSGKTVKKLPEAYWQIIKNGYWKQEYIQNGGGQNTYFKDGEFEKVNKNGLLKVVTIPFDAISALNGAIEMAPRLAEYIASREEGRSVQTSMLDASRVTTNFKAGGDATKFANRNGATFLNASVQGATQVVRNLKEANQKGLKGWTMLACKLTVAGIAPMILNNMIWSDDDDYEQLQDYVKDNYYIVAKKNDGTFIRIPKGRTVAVVQKIVSNVGKYLNNNQELNIDEISKDFWETVKFGVENLAPSNPIDNNVISPIFQAITNTSWYGEDIVPERLQDVPNAEQYDETTDKFSRWLGEKTGISPMKINYLLDQYGGGASDVLLPLGTPQAENTPMEDKFTTDPIMKSKYPGEFFEKADEITVASNSINASDADILKGKYISYIQGNMNNLYKQKREIQNSTATDEEKKKQLKEIQKQINETAKMAIEEVDKASITNTTALIGNEEFYKNAEGEWQRIKDENKIPEVSMKSYADYTVKKEKATEQKRIEKGNNDATLNDTEKVELIKNSNYSNVEKDALYDDQIDDKTYKNLKLLNKNNINKINQYLDYKSADLVSDKVDDGTKNGKSVSGSKKKKIETYLNNSSFNGIERLYLYGQTYELNASQRKYFDNYIKSLKLTPEETKQIYLDLSSSNIVEMKDGSIRWK